MTTEIVSPNRLKNRAKKEAALQAAEELRLLRRIQNLFILEGWSTERIAEAVELPRAEVIRLIQTTALASTGAQR